MSTFHYVLSQRKSDLWHYCDPDLKRRAMDRMFSALGSVSAKYNTVKIYDAGEQHIATMELSGR